MRVCNRALPLVLIVAAHALVSGTPLFATEWATANFVYITELEDGGETLERRSALGPDLKVLPFATVELTFDHSISGEDQAAFFAEFRVLNETDQVPLQHLHEVALDLPASGPHASYYWHNDRTLFYTPLYLPAGKQCSFIMPEGWSLTNEQTYFETTPLTGEDQPIYHVIISDQHEWQITTTAKPVFRVDSYKDCLFIDVRSDRQYFDTSIHIRGYTSKLTPKKSYIIKFASDQLFEGFRDVSGEYQGARRNIILNGAYRDRSQQRTRLSYDITRKLEQRILGVALSADSYFAQVLINGRAWGTYTITEKIGTGNGGWSTMKDRREHGLLKNGFLHKGARFGVHYPRLKAWMHPKTEYEQTIGVGDGVQQFWEDAIRYPVYVERTGGSHPLDFDFELEALSEDTGEQMEIIPDIDNAELPFMDFDLIEKETHAVAGSIAIDESWGWPRASLSVTFPEPVMAGEKVEAEYLSTYDYDRFNQAIAEDYSEIFEWLDVESILINIFFCRLSNAFDNLQHNYYQFMNSADFETFMDGDLPKEKYVHIFWDGDGTFNTPLEVLPAERHAISWKLLEGIYDARKLYVNRFHRETIEGGVLTIDFYQRKMEEYDRMLGNGSDVESRRWHPVDEGSLREFLAVQLESNDFIENYVLSLKPLAYLEPDHYSHK